jgi:Ca2+-binding EF-hand superfamily protein
VRDELQRRGEDPLTLRAASGTPRSDDISFHEISVGLNRLGIKCSVGTAKRMFNQMHKQMARFAADPAAARARKPRDLGSDELAEARVVFDKFDADGGGSIDVHELHGALTDMGMECSLFQAKKIVEAVDVDGDGTVDFVEFKWMLAQIPPLEGGVHHRIAFAEVNLGLRPLTKAQRLREARRERAADAERKRRLKAQWAEERRQFMEGDDGTDPAGTHPRAREQEARGAANRELLGAVL